MPVPSSVESIMGWLTITVILGMSLILSPSCQAACEEPFVELNDTNCYFIAADWTNYQGAKEVCQALDSRVYIPSRSQERFNIKRQIDERLPVPLYWTGVERKITNLTTLQFEWIDGNTGDKMQYSIMNFHSRIHPQVTKWALHNGAYYTYHAPKQYGYHNQSHRMMMNAYALNNAVWPSTKYTGGQRYWTERFPRDDNLNFGRPFYKIKYNVYMKKCTVEHYIGYWTELRPQYCDAKHSFVCFKPGDPETYTFQPVSEVPRVRHPYFHKGLGDDWTNPPIPGA